MALKISWPRLLAVAVVYVIVGEIIMTLGAMADMNYYTDSAYASVWSKIMMPTAGPPPAEFYYTSIAFQLVTGFLFALVYAVIKGAVPGKGWTNKGLMYGFLVFLIAGLPTTMMLISLVNLPLGLLFSWMLQSLIVYLLMGLAAAKILK
jgi:hypothetical protein